MMKKIFTYAAAAAALMIAASCSEETSFNKGVYEGGDAIALKLHMDNGIETKSDGVGQENAVNSVQYFFYTDTLTAPVYTSARIENPTMTNNAYTISVIAGQDFPSLNVLFPTNGAKVVVFGVFNYPEAITAAPLQTVKALAVEQHFAFYYTDPTIYTEERSGYKVIDDGMVGADPENPVEKYFVMTGQKEIELNGTGNYAVNYTADADVVEMRRLEAKFTFVVNVEDEIVNTSSSTTTSGEGESATTTTTTVTETWTPILNKNNVRIYLCNADNTAVLGAPDASPTYSYNEPSRFNYAPVIVSPESADSYTINSPEFYSYPMTWEKGESTEPFVKLIVPWKMEQTTKTGDGEPVVTYTTERELYYKVMFPESVINSNNHYQFTINVSLLGSEFEDPTVTIPSQAQILPWSSNSKVNPVISDAKYLSLEKAEVNSTFTQTVYEGRENDFETIYTNGTTVGFAASDIVSVELINVYQQNLSTKLTEYFVQNGTISNSAITTYNNRNSGKATETTYSAAVINGWVQVDNDLKVIELNHVLNSDMTSYNFDVTPYTYEVKVHLGANNTVATYNDDSYTKYIKIIQYPQVYVVANPNSNNGTATNAGVFVNGSNSTISTYGNQYQGYYYSENDPNVFARGHEHQYTYYYSYYNTETRTGYYNGYNGGENGYYNLEYHNGYYNLGGANGISANALNKNPNMYVITVSVSDKYIIGDPRTNSIDSDFINSFYRASGNRVSNGYYNVTVTDQGRSVYVLSSKTSNWVSAPRTYATGNGILANYHPASNDHTSNMIAPKIRVASSYGVSVTGRTREEAEYRCASYQEDGIPAGRWRLPTYAEVEFIGTLSALGRIPYLFGSIVRDSEGNAELDENGNEQGLNDDSYYWTANGLIHINNGTNTVESATSDPDSQESVRCVYDEWFWGDATTRPVAKNTFTWGDVNY